MMFSIMFVNLKLLWSSDQQTSWLSGVKDDRVNNVLRWIAKCLIYIQESDMDPATLIDLSKFKQQIMKQSSNKYILLNPSV